MRACCAPTCRSRVGDATPLSSVCCPANCANPATAPRLEAVICAEAHETMLRTSCRCPPARGRARAAPASVTSTTLPPARGGSVPAPRKCQFRVEGLMRVTPSGSSTNAAAQRATSAAIPRTGSGLRGRVGTRPRRSRRPPAAGGARSRRPAAGVRDPSGPRRRRSRRGVAREQVADERAQLQPESGCPGGRQTGERAPHTGG